VISVKKLLAAFLLLLFMTGFGYFIEAPYIPVNIDGGQGKVVYELVLPRGVTRVSLYLLDMDVPTVNIGIIVDGQGYLYAMHLPQRNVIEFDVNGESSVSVVMSTNYYYPGAAGLFFQAQSFAPEAVAARAVEKIKDLLEYLDDFNGPLRYADLWTPLLFAFFEPIDEPILQFALVYYGYDTGMLRFSTEDLLPLINEETIHRYGQEGMGIDGFGLMLAIDMLTWLADEDTAQHPHLWQPLLTTNWTIAQPLTLR
jgi:hypothetical protein